MKTLFVLLVLLVLTGCTLLMNTGKDKVLIISDDELFYLVRNDSIIDYDYDSLGLTKKLK